MGRSTHALLVFALAACGGAEPSGGTAPERMAPDACDGLVLSSGVCDPCPQGTAAADDGKFCVPAPLPAECPRGTIGALGDTACRAIGWTDPCPSGWRRDANDEACEPVLPTVECPQGTMPVIGNNNCEAVGWDAPCPPGFTRDAESSACLPVLPTRPCDGVAIEIFGSTACEPVMPCGAGKWPQWPAGAPVIFVDDDAMGAAEDGTELSPFSRLQDAIDAAADGAFIAVAGGDYSAGIVVSGRQLTIAGVCPERVRLRGAGAGLGLEAAGGSTVTLSGVTLTNHAQALGVIGASTLRIERSVVYDNLHCGLFALGSGNVVTIDRVAIRGTRVDANDIGGVGIIAIGGTRLEASDLVLAGNHRLGLHADGPSTIVTLDRTLVRDTAADGSSDTVEAGIFATSSASVSVQRSALLGNRYYGLRAAGASVHVRESVIMDSRPTAGGGRAGHAVLASASAALGLHSVLLAGNRDAAVSLDGEGTRATITKSVIRGTVPTNASRSAGHGVNLDNGAHVQLSNTLIDANTSCGVCALGPGSRAVVWRSAVIRTRAVGENLAIAVHGSDGASLDLHNVAAGR